MGSCCRILRSLSQSSEMLQVGIISLNFLLCGVFSKRCIDFTKSDMEGPFFLENVPLKYKIAPDNEIQEPSKGAIIRGKILDKNCKGIAGATVDAWYAGGSEPHYTFRNSSELLYRGKTKTKKNGGYEFLGSFPGVYTLRPILHIHYKVLTPGPKGQTFTSQLYFRHQVPRNYVNYVKGRGSQFGKVSAVKKGNATLPNGGRKISFN